MTQPSDSTYTHASGLSGTALRTAQNDYNEGILTMNAGATDPATVFPFMWYADTGDSPNTIKIANPGGTAFITVAEIDSDSVTFFSDGAQVLSLSNTEAFTASQTIDVSGAAGSLLLRSDLATGIAAFLDFAGHDDGGNDTVYASIDMSIEDDTDGSEDGQLLLKVIRDGADTTVVTIGDTVDVDAALDATTLQQGGTDLDDIIEAAKGNQAETSLSSTTQTVPDDLDRGEANVFDGSSASTWTVNSGGAGDVYQVINDSSVDITFAEGTGVTIVGGLTLGGESVCCIHYITTTRVYIYGQNA